MLFDDTAFLHSLATWAAPRAAASLGSAVSYGTNLFTNRADEQAPIGSGPDPYAVLRTYGGTNDRTNPKPTISVQLEVIGKSVVAAKRLAQALYEGCVLDSIGRELRMTTIPAFDPAGGATPSSWMIVDALTVSRPGQLAQDDRGRVRVAANFDLGFYYIFVPV
jgi:hypothetical protein